jgi:UDP-N-acetylglucosamine--N-acetylmuramyl-(pentapeptide) pyrophosphoryl-undecaprenol N-acetylglucosamine transferase
LSQQLKIIISGGGTGGHIFPAIAIARAVEEMKPGTEILFVGAIGRMEMEKVPAAGYRIEGLQISGISRTNMIKNISLPSKVLKSVKRAKEIISEFKPDTVVGVGGYASGPTLWAAIRKHIPTLIQEQNSYPGITNKILGKRVNKICVAYPGMEKYFPAGKLIMAGNPVRQDISSLEAKHDDAIKYFNLKAGGPVLLVIGGSLGAKTINESIKTALQLFMENDIQVIWQTGKSFYNEANELAKQYSNIKVSDFISKMDYAYAASDIVVSRAGAISIAELCIAGKTCILVPSPNVAEDHQTKNANSLALKSAAIVIKDDIAVQQLGKEVMKLVNDGALRKSLGENIKSLAIKDSAQKIAKEIIELSGK